MKIFTRKTIRRKLESIVKDLNKRSEEIAILRSVFRANNKESEAEYLDKVGQMIFLAKIKIEEFLEQY